MNPETSIPTHFEKSIGPWIGKTEKLMSLFMRDAFYKEGIEMTREQFVVLVKLSEQDGIMQKDLAYITDRNKGSLARLINTMEKKNFVARIPSEEDKRVNKVFLTRYGKETFEKMQPIVWKCIEEIQKGLSSEEIGTLIQLLKKVQKNIIEKK